MFHLSFFFFLLNVCLAQQSWGLLLLLFFCCRRLVETWHWLKFGLVSRLLLPPPLPLPAIHSESIICPVLFGSVRFGSVRFGLVLFCFIIVCCTLIYSLLYTCFASILSGSICYLPLRSLFTFFSLVLLSCRPHDFVICSVLFVEMCLNVFVCLLPPIVWLNLTDFECVLVFVSGSASCDVSLFLFQRVKSKQSNKTNEFTLFN